MLLTRAVRTAAKTPLKPLLPVLPLPRTRELVALGVVVEVSLTVDWVVEVLLDSVLVMDSLAVVD